MTPKPNNGMASSHQPAAQTFQKCASTTAISDPGSWKDLRTAGETVHLSRLKQPYRGVIRHHHPGNQRKLCRGYATEEIRLTIGVYSKASHKLSSGGKE